MGFIKGIASGIKTLAKGAGSKGKALGTALKQIIKTKLKFTVIGPVVIPVVLVTSVLFGVGTMFGEKINLLQMVDPNNKTESDCVKRGSYDSGSLEEYYNMSEAAYESKNKPSEDLASTEYKTVDKFNEHIKQNVCSAGYGTREGVVAAGISLVGDYIKATGKRLRYSLYPGRQWFDGNNEGIINDDFYLDCSSFSWWALYNGGFNVPCYPYTGTMMSWARGAGYTKTPGPGVGQAGDFLLRHTSDDDGHIVFIIGTYDDGYYCAEESNYGVGAKISKRSYSSLGKFVVVDMSAYYSNASNVRSGGSCDGYKSSDCINTGTGIYTEEDFADAVNVGNTSAKGGSYGDFVSSLSGSSFKDPDGFNSFIKSNVQKAGFGTVEGVIAAAMALCYELPKETGSRYFYYFGAGNPRHGIEGITPETPLDCRSFVQWAIYNGGFNANELNYIGTYGGLPDIAPVKNDVRSAKPGDIFSTDGTGHIWLVVAVTNDGYYAAEEYSGAEINFYSWDNAYNGYGARLYDMSGYYNNPANVRSS